MIFFETFYFPSGDKLENFKVKIYIGDDLVCERDGFEDDLACKNFIEGYMEGAGKVRQLMIEKYKINVPR